jgi:integrase
VGTKWFTGGVIAASRGRIQFDFMFEGVRYRPSIQRLPSEANLRRARERIEEIKRQIEVGTFCFTDEFPDYRFLRRLSGTATVRTCNDVFDAFLAHCEARFGHGDMAAVTLSSYRRVLNRVWRPALGNSLFHQVRYSRLVAIADAKPWSKKTYNNTISILRRAFDFGYRDHPEQHNLARSLHSARLRKADRPRIDPFCMQDAETLIAAIHRDWGEAQGNYDEFRLLSGMRPSEEIALVLSDLDLVNGIVSVNKARVAGIDRDQTKTGDDRRITLCPRALAVLKRQLALRARLETVGVIRHDHVFFRETGDPFRNLQIQARRWRATLTSLKLRCRRPYVARHSSVSWNLMIGKNPLWIAKQHGHSLSKMLRVYAAWAEDMVESDVDAIQHSMNRHARLKPAGACQRSAAARPRLCRASWAVGVCSSRIEQQQARGNLAVHLPVETTAKNVSAGKERSALSGRWVTHYSEHIGNTFGHLRGDANAVAGVFQDGRTTEVRGSVARRREDGGAVPRIRYLSQDRLQDLLPLQGLRPGGADGSQPPALPARLPAAVSDRELDPSAQARAPQLGSSEDPGEDPQEAQRDSTAGDQHRACRARSARLGQSTSPQTLQGRGHRAVTSAATERAVVRRLQRRVHAGRQALLLSADHHGCRKPLSVEL